MEREARKPYPTDVTDEEWAFVAPYLSLMRPDARQRTYDPGEGFKAWRWFVRTGAPWRSLPGNIPPWEAVSQEPRCGIEAGCCEDLVHDLRAVLRWSEGRADDATAAMLDSRTVQSTPESGARAGKDGHKRRKGSKIHLAVEPLGYRLALRVTPAKVQERAEVGALAQAVQEATGKTVEVAVVDQGDTGEQPAAAAVEPGTRLEVVTLPEAKWGSPALGGRALLCLGKGVPSPGQGR